MPTQRSAQTQVRDILRLRALNKDAAEIAAELGIHRLEVATILAHERMRGVAEAKADETSWDHERGTGDIAPSSGELRPGDTGNDPDSANGDPDNHEANSSPELTRIYLGEDIELEQPVVWEPANGRTVQNPHLMIMGESGSGKTYAAQAIVAELAEAGLPAILFDFGQSFEVEELDKNFQRVCKPIEYRIGEEGLALNPLEIAAKDIRGPNQVATRLADVFDAAFQLGEIQKKVFIDATMSLYAASGILPSDKATWSRKAPSIQQLQDAIDQLAADRTYANVRNAAGLSARLTPFFMLSAFGESTWSWDDLLSNDKSRVHILQFRGLEGKTQRVLVEMLLWHMFYHLKGGGQASLRVFCVLDEAHHLSFRESGPLTQLLREARKFGLGIIFASQQPEDFSPVAYSNSASKLVFQTADPKLKVSRFLAGKVANYDRPEEIRDVISGLTRGRAFFISGGRGDVVEIADFRKRSTLWRAQ